MDGLGGDVQGLLAGADPKRRATVYADLGLTLTYHPGEDRVDVQAVPLPDLAVQKVVSEGRLTPYAQRCFGLG